MVFFIAHTIKHHTIPVKKHNSNNNWKRLTVHKSQIKDTHELVLSLSFKHVPAQTENNIQREKYIQIYVRTRVSRKWKHGTLYPKYICEQNGNQKVM